MTKSTAKAALSGPTTAPRTFGEAVDRSMAACAPDTLMTDWAANTPEGRLLTAAQAMGRPKLVAWMMAAPMG